jgi:hypothetical protein
MTSQWGRIDADGTVYVHTDAGERVVGSWQAGNAAAGLAYYERRYEDLATEVTLLEQRLASGAADPVATRSHATELAQQLPSASVVGDLVALQARLTVLLAAADQAIDAQAAAREQARADAIAAKESLVLEAEKIAETAGSWKTSGDRLRAIVEEWKQIKGVDRRTDDTLWKRFAAARDAFGKRRGQHFAQLDAERSASRAAKEDLVRRAEQLAQSADWKEATPAMRELMAEWKAAPRGSRDVENALWTRFRAAQDAYFARRGQVLNERDSEQVANLKRKSELISAAEQLDLADPKAAQAALRDLQARFDEVGHVPRDAIRPTDERMRLAAQRVRDAVDADWRRSAVESSPFLAALRERLAEAEEKLRRAQAHGDAARIARAEAEVSQRRSLMPE